jgi:hypothetical protein
MPDGLQVQTTDEYLIFKIPWGLIPTGEVSSMPIKPVKPAKKEKLTATEALKIFDKGKKEYLAGRLKPISSLKELI